MKLEKALRLVTEKYTWAKAHKEIHDPVAWALYQVWRIADDNKSKGDEDE